jgi:5-methylcytosine-specific restriction protein A
VSKPQRSMSSGKTLMAFSRRHAPLPPGWYKTRLRILKRDGYRCTWIRQDSTGGRCPERATHCDHVDPLGPETDDNLRALCEYHHKIKSSGEGGRAVHKNAAKTKKKHPGQI